MRVERFTNIITAATFVAAFILVVVVTLFVTITLIRHMTQPEPQASANAFLLENHCIAFHGEAPTLEPGQVYVTPYGSRQQYVCSNYFMKER